MQHSLFGTSPLAFDTAMARLERRRLGRGAWVDYLPNWLDGADAFFDRLLRETNWHHQRRMMYERVVEVPRLVATPCESSGSFALLRNISEALTTHYGQSLDSVSLALYRDGSDSVAPHGDKIGRRFREPIVAIVSVGAPRRFNLKPKGGGAGLRYSLGWGDLLVMGGTCQRTWLHSVPKAAHALPRISIMFRPSVPCGATSPTPAIENGLNTLRAPEPPYQPCSRTDGEPSTRQTSVAHLGDRTD